jgi:hypothetical protein
MKKTKRRDPSPTQGGTMDRFANQIHPRSKKSMNNKKGQKISSSDP